MVEKPRTRDRLRRFLSRDIHNLNARQAFVAAPGVSTANTTLTTSAQPTPPAPLRPHPPGKDLWAEALRGLSEEHRKIISQAGSGTKLGSLGALIEAAEQQRKDFDERRWVVRWKDDNIVLRDLADKIVFWLNKFKEVGDVVVNFDPVHAALPWAAVRFLLQVAVVEKEQMAALLTGLEKVTNVISRCIVYEALFLQEPHEGLETSQKAAANLEKGLISLYAAILQFVALACKLYQKITFSRTFHGILNLNTVTGFVGRCERLEQTVDLEAANCQSAVSAERENKLRNILVQLREPIERIDSRVSSLCDRLNDEERSKTLTWISDIPYIENHLTACQDRLDGTCTWLLEHQKYLDWRRSSASTILWLHGSPGTGKTKLVSSVVDDIRLAIERRSNDEALAYFYCDRNQANRQDPELLLNNLVRQLSAAQGGHSLPRLIHQLYTQEKKEGFASGRLRFEKSQSLLAQLISIYPQVTLVVDALDECDVRSRHKLIEALETLVKESSSLLKVFISSRPDRDIKHRFSSGHNKEIRATDNRDDIEKFVVEKLATSPKYWQKQLTPALRAEICEVLIKESDGMFQWVSLQLAQLFDLSIERDIKERLGRLPDTLEKAYDEIYTQICSQKGSAPLIADRAFQWVMCSCAPLSPAELASAVCQDPETDDLNDVDATIDIDIVLHACRNLLTVDKQLYVCRFSHLSVQEYFETRHWKQSEANTTVAKVCLKLLNHPECQRDYIGLMTPLIQYARNHWPTHVKRCEGNTNKSRLSSLLTSFLGPVNESSPAYRNWHKAVGRDLWMADRYSNKLRNFYGELSPPAVNALPICVFGFYDLLKRWWMELPIDIELRNGNDHTLLQLASAGGHTMVVQELLHRGADINAQHGLQGDTALSMACTNGHKDMVELLLKNGADVNAKSRYFCNALHVATGNGYMDIVELLLENGADVNAQGCLTRQSALYRACFGGYENIVKLLLDNGAEVNAQGGSDRRSALYQACYRGYENIVKLLLEHRADVNAQNGMFREAALLGACYRGHEKIVKLLLEHGADVNTQSGVDDETALYSACYRGDGGIVKLLLENGADVNAQSGWGKETALHRACLGGKEDVVKLLLESGADVNAQSGLENITALYQASKKGHEEIADLLLKHGAKRTQCIDNRLDAKTSRA